MKTKCFKSTRRQGVLLVLATFAGLAAQQSEGAELSNANAVGELPEVQVTATREAKEGTAESGYRNDYATTGPLGKMPLQDTPYSINVTSGELIENSGAHTMADALKTNPTVAPTQLPRTWVSIPRAAIRGFEPMYLRDGLYVHTLIPPAVENVERIEVLNGLSGFLYGFGNLGGSINFISKQPLENPLTEISLGTYGGGVNYLQSDLGGSLIEHSDRATYRVNAYREQGDNYIKGGNQERTLVSAAVNFKVAPDTLLKTGFYHQDYINNGLQTTFVVDPSKGIAVPKAFDPKKLYSQPWTQVKGMQDIYDIGMEHRLNEVFNLRAAYRYNHVYRKYNGIYSTLADNNGNYTETLADFAPQDYDMSATYALVDAKFDTGQIKHESTFGYSGYSYLQKTNATSRIYVNLPGTYNIDSPTYISKINQFAPTEENNHAKQVYDSYLDGDRISFDQRWSALVGLNHAVYHYKVERVDTGAITSNYSQSKNTPSLALIYKPIPSLTSYFSYMEGIVAGGTAPTTATNAGTMLPPSASEQSEVGVKTRIADSDLAIAYFRTDKINEYTDPGDKVYKQDGRQLHKGWELTCSGKITEHLTLIGGLTLLDAAIVRAKANVATEGKTPVNIPEKQLRAYFEYALLEVTGLTASAGMNYYGKRPVDVYNRAYISEDTTFDAGLRYQGLAKGKKVSINLNILNIFNRYYWAGYLDGSGLQQGDPRTASLSAKIAL